MRRAIIATATLALAGCDWISLGANALTYESLAAGEAGNVAVSGNVAYATLGAAGLLVHPLSSNGADTLPPPAGMQSVDDIASDGTFLFVLDARPPGHLAVLSLVHPERPITLSPPIAVPVGPFSGISARAGVLVVSGGTSRLTIWRYGDDGTLTGPVAEADFGRGQPDVLVAGDETFFVSTHRWGPYFGVSRARADTASRAVVKLGALGIDQAGFTAGGTKPANFPLELAVVDDTSLLAAHAGGVSLIQHDRSGLRLRLTIDVGGEAVNVDASGDTAAVAVAGSSPAIVILSLAGAPRVIRRIAMIPGTIPLGVAFSRHHIVVAARDRGMLTWPR